MDCMLPLPVRLTSSHHDMIDLWSASFNDSGQCWSQLYKVDYIQALPHQVDVAYHFDEKIGNIFNSMVNHVQVALLEWLPWKGTVVLPYVLLKVQYLCGITNQKLVQFIWIVT